VAQPHYDTKTASTKDGTETILKNAVCNGPTGPGLECGHNGPVRVADGVTIAITGLHTGDGDVTVTR
jgi:hypothetical protein